MSRTLPFALLLIATLLSACASNSFKYANPAPAGVSLKNSKVYAYSFLDIRDSDLGADMVKEIGTQLVLAMKKEGVTLEFLPFKESVVGHAFSSSGGSMTIPLRQTIANNRQKETAFAPQYRLVIFPSQMRVSGAWKFYDIRWDLSRASDGELLWQNTSQGKHMTLWTNDESPESRAKEYVETIIEGFRSSGLI